MRTEALFDGAPVPLLKNVAPNLDRLPGVVGEDRFLPVDVDLEIPGQERRRRLTPVDPRRFFVWNPKKKAFKR